MGDADQIPLDRITGMVALASATDIRHYIPLTGREPQLSEEGPAWIVTVHDDLRFPGGGGIMVDPACVVTGHDAARYGINGWRNPTTGTVTPPETPAQRPDRPMPTLAP